MEKARWDFKRTWEKLTNVFGSGCHWSSQLGHKLFGIQSYFYDVVQQSEEGSEGERRHKQSHKAKLDDWWEERKESDCQLDTRYDYNP